MPWESRAAIFLKAANLVAGPYRSKINAATMIAQSKTIYQAEIDAACEFIDFLRFNVQFMREIYEKQPENTSEIWNRLEYRPLEGFVYAISPFNFTISKQSSIIRTKPVYIRGDKGERQPIVNKGNRNWCLRQLCTIFHFIYK